MKAPPEFEKNFRRNSFAEGYVHGVQTARDAFRTGRSAGRIRDDVEILIQEMEAPASHGHVTMSLNIQEGRLTGYLHQVAHAFDPLRGAGVAVELAPIDVLDLARAAGQSDYRAAMAVGYAEGFERAREAVATNGTAAIVADANEMIVALRALARKGWSNHRAAVECGLRGYSHLLASWIFGCKARGIGFGFPRAPRVDELEAGAGELNLEVKVSLAGYLAAGTADTAGRAVAIRS